MKKTLKIIGIVLGALIGVALLAAVAVITWLSVTEYKPEPVEPVEIASNVKAPLDRGEFTVLSWNIGYCALGEESEFFMDGGKEVRPDDKSIIRKNYAGILAAIRAENPEFVLLQEADSDSRRSYSFDQTAAFRKDLGGSSAYALNYRCNFVPFPMPPIGKVSSGLLTFSDYGIREAKRISLPCPFSWPVRAANLKRCLLITRIPIDATEKELVLVNLHLEAYDDGEGKKAQTEQLLTLLSEEYRKGNYVIAGGDWNQVFPGTLETYPIHVENWLPGVLDAAEIGEWSFAYDDSVPTCRLLNQPYDPADAENTQYYVIDGFLVSPNLKISSVETLDQGFACSDHNPVLLTVALGE